MNIYFGFGNGTGYGNYLENVARTGYGESSRPNHGRKSTCEGVFQKQSTVTEQLTEQI